MKEWNGVRGSGGDSSGGGLKAGNAGADIFNEIVTSLKALGLGGLSGDERWSVGAVRWRGVGIRRHRVGRGEESRGGKRGRKNVVPVVEGGREGGILQARGEKGGWGKGRRRKEAGELKSVSVRARARHPIVFGYGLVKRGRNVKEPSGSKL